MARKELLTHQIEVLQGIVKDQAKEIVSLKTKIAELESGGDAKPIKVTKKE